MFPAALRSSAEGQWCGGEQMCVAGRSPQRRPHRTCKALQGFRAPLHISLQGLALFRGGVLMVSHQHLIESTVDEL
jgi:hypothetical protein